MLWSAGESVNIVVREGIRAAIADTGKHKSKDNQPLRQEEQIKLLQKERRRETGKQAKEQQLLARESEDEEISEEESPKKPESDGTFRSRKARLNYGQPSYRDLNEQLSNMQEDGRRNLSEQD